jgi:hypothetical protein
VERARPNPLPPKFPSTLVQAPTHGSPCLRRQGAAFESRLRIKAATGCGGTLRLALSSVSASGVMTSVPSIGDALMLRPEARDGRDKFVPRINKPRLWVAEAESNV